MRFLGVVLTGLMVPVLAQADMVVRTNDGRSFTVPVAAGEVRSIEFTAAAKAQGFGGAWTTNWGRLTLEQNGNQVSGSYDSDGGRMKGEIQGDRMNGFWSENMSDRKCDTAMDGRSYWGRVILTLEPSGGAFKGKWGYCFDDPATSGKDPWTGTR